MRLGIFRIRSLTGANLAMLAVAGGMFAVFYFASIYLQQTLGFTPVQTGLAFLPLTAGIIVFSGVAQQIVARLGVREVAMVGMGAAAIGLLLLSRAPVDGTYVADVLPGLLVMSAGLGLTFVPMTLIATTNVTDEDAGLASGIFNSSQQIGGALGLAILSTVAATQTSNALESAGAQPDAAQQASALVDGFQSAFAIGAGLMLLGVVIAALLHPPPRRRRRGRGPERGPRRVGRPPCPRTSAPTRAATGRRSWRPRRSCSPARAPASAWTISRGAPGWGTRPSSGASPTRRS